MSAAHSLFKYCSKCDSYINAQLKSVAKKHDCVINEITWQIVPYSQQCNLQLGKVDRFGHVSLIEFQHFPALCPIYVNPLDLGPVKFTAIFLHHNHSLITFYFKNAL